MHVHYDFDRRRFLEPGADAEQGYAWFLGTQIEEEDALVLVVVEDDEVVGYVYATIEPRSWQMLLDEAAVIHDVIVDEPARRHGVAAALLEGAFEWIRRRGVPRVVLHTADQNAAAQRLFTRLGFRRTMVEMTRNFEA
jgi:ribosomal protein S18 acetylase RimI-like enzyme